MGGCGTSGEHQRDALSGRAVPAVLKLLSVPGDTFTLADAATVGTVAGVVVGGLGGLRRIYVATLGRRRVLARKLGRLAPGVALGYVNQLFGEPTFSDDADSATVLVWVEPEFYLQARVEGRSVAAWSVTVRKRTFRPRFFRRRVISADGATLEAKIGKTTFSDLPGRPHRVQSFMGAHDLNYAECHYYGNPGQYLDYVYALNDAGAWYKGGTLIGFMHDARSMSFDDGDEEVAAFLNTRGAAEARRTKFNTIGTVLGGETQRTELLIAASGPDKNRVRLLAPPRPPSLRDVVWPTRRWSMRRRRSR